MTTTCFGRGPGEGFFNADAVRGLGIFKSEDFGETWTQLPPTDNSDFYYVNRLARLPGTNVLLAATRSGLFRSGDLGASWTDVGPLSTTSRGYVDLKVDPSNSNRLLAYHFGADDLPRVTLTINSPGPIVGDYLAVHAPIWAPAHGFGGDHRRYCLGGRRYATHQRWL